MRSIFSAERGNKEILRWTGTVYALSFLCWLPLLLEQRGADPPDSLLGLRYLFVLVPAAVSAVFLVKGRGLKSYWLTGFQRISVRALLFCLAAGLAGWLLAAAYGLAGGEPLFSAAYPSVRAFISAFVYLYATALAEELAWRGYLFRKLSNGRPRMKAALLSGVIWAFWHVPMWMIRNGLGWRDVLPLLVWAALLGIVLGEFYGRYGSLPAAALLHAAFNTFFLTPAIYNDLVLFLAITVYYAIKKYRKGVKEYL